MGAVILKALSFIFIIALGYALKKIHLFGDLDYKVAMKIVLNITLPAAIVTSFASCEIQPILLLLALFGLVMNVIMLVVAYLVSKHKETAMRAAWLNVLPGYNIGAFVVPFVQTFLTTENVVACCIFDAGSAIMCTGCTYALSGVILGQNRFSLKDAGRRLLGSRPFLFYTGMLILTIIGVKVPDGVISFISPIAAANPFLAMLMVGMMLDFNFPAEERKEIFLMVGIRILSAAIVAVPCILFIPGTMGKALAMALMGPVSVAATALGEKAGAKPAVVACINSLSIIVSIIVITGLVIAFGA